MRELVIILPAYNEQDTIESVLRDWHKIVETVGGESLVLLICDGSRDDTPKIARSLSRELGNLEVIEKTNTGHGGACLYGYREAISKGARYIFQTDSDGQTSPDDFWDLWANRERFDAQIGFRRYRQDGISRKIVSRVLGLVLFLYFKTWLRDANTPFRLVNSSSLEKFVKFAPENFFLANVLMTVFLVKTHARISWSTISFKPRRTGVNTVNMKKIIAIGVQSLNSFREQSLKLNRYLQNLSGM